MKTKYTYENGELQIVTTDYKDIITFITAKYCVQEFQIHKTPLFKNRNDVDELSLTDKLGTVFAYIGTIQHYNIN